jgi:ATP-dependent RNA helicase RhlB
MAGPFSAAPKPSESMQNETTSEWSLEQFQVPEKEGETRFHDFDLEPALMHGIADAGFQYCTPIQAQVLTHALAGADTIGRAQTGTGKTAAFLITIINDLLRHPITVPRYAGEPRALIVAPTRELAMQIEKDAKLLAHHTDLQVMSVVGGMNFNRQQERLQTRLIDILVATPGRLLDFAKRRDLWLDRVEALVLDEADRMLDMGFIPDVKRIVNMTPSTRSRQTQLCSVDQKVYITATQDKFNLLYNLITRENMSKVIVFANRRDITRRLNDRLHKKGLNVSLISGDVPQNQRMKTLERFRAGDLQVLIATDVAGRGIHIEGVSHVINYNLPEDPEDYVHRIGRTGRAGANGVSISFACEDDAFLLPQLEQAIGMKLNCVHPETALVADQ